MITTLFSQVIWIGFILFQTLVQKERIVSVASIVATVAMLALSTNLRFDIALFFICALIGFSIERILIRGGEQHFSQASLFGMPVWLPLVWGMGGVAMIRLGDTIVPMFGLLVFTGIGFLYGTVVEVILGYIGRTQHWKDTSFFGVPPWLPLAWAAGFGTIWTIVIFIRNLVGV